MSNALDFEKYEMYQRSKQFLINLGYIVLSKDEYTALLLSSEQLRAELNQAIYMQDKIRKERNKTEEELARLIKENAELLAKNK